jgi:hypothetical protein
MIINWEDIRWEADDAGTSRATLADEEHNSLTLENRDGKITFRTDGSPTFNTSTVLEITALCMLLSKEDLGRAELGRPARITTRGAQPDPGEPDGETFVPEPRQALDTEPHDIEPEATELAQAGYAGRSRRKPASRRGLSALTR